MMRPIFDNMIHPLLEEDDPNLPVVYLVNDNNSSPPEVSIFIEVIPTKHSLPTAEGKDTSTPYAPLDNRYFKEFVMDGYQLLFSAFILGKCDLNTFISRYDLDACPVGVEVTVDDHSQGDRSVEDIIVFGTVLPFTTFKVAGNTDYIILDPDKYKQLHDTITNNPIKNIPLFVNIHKLRTDKLEHDALLRERSAIRNQGFMRLPGSM